MFRFIRLSLFSLGFLCTGILPLCAQGTLTSKEKILTKLWDKAEYYYVIRQYETALIYLGRIKALTPEDPKVYWKMGYANHQNHPEKAIPLYEKCLSLDSTQVYSLFNIGQCYQFLGDYHKALPYYNAFVKHLPPEQGMELAEAQHAIEECNQVLDLMMHPRKVEISPLDTTINTPYDDEHPVFANEGKSMMFSSRRSGAIGGKLASDGEFYQDVWFTDQNKKTNAWQAVSNEMTPVNTGAHEAAQCLSADGKELIFYRYDKKYRGDLYVVKRKGNSWKYWGTPRSLGPSINSYGWESSAYLADGGNLIFFSSDRPDGSGGKDLYWAKKSDKGAWQKAENLGAVINTYRDEFSPFFSAKDSTLYFASKGHGGLGGYDIFSSVYHHGTWSVPVNLGYPINSSYDECFFTLLPDSDIAYISSNRKDSRGGYDIWMIRLLEPLTGPSVTPPVKTVEAPPVKKDEVPVREITQAVLLGAVRDHESQSPLNAEILVADITGNKEIATGKADTKTGEYYFRLASGKTYRLMISHPGYFTEAVDISVPAGSTGKVRHDVTLRKIKKEESVVLKNIYFDSGTANLRSESELALNAFARFLLDNPDTRVEVSGHTDNLGSDEYNMNLSLERARSVSRYLVSKGVADDRLRSKGYGETKPVSGNDTDEGRQLNRRIEFKILD